MSVYYQCQYTGACAPTHEREEVPNGDNHQGGAGQGAGVDRSAAPLGAVADQPSGWEAGRRAQGRLNQHISAPRARRVSPRLVASRCLARPGLERDRASCFVQAQARTQRGIVTSSCCWNTTVTGSPISIVAGSISLIAPSADASRLPTIRILGSSSSATTITL